MRVIPLIPVLFFCFVPIVLTTAQTPAESEDFLNRLEVADASFEEGSFRQARTLYRQLLSDWRRASPMVEENLENYLEFRLHDAAWREVAGREGRRNREQLSAAREGLETLHRELREANGSDRPPALYPEVAAALGEWHLAAMRYPDWRSSWHYFAEALDWWAGTTDLEAGRAAYLGLVRRFANYAERPDTNYPTAVSYIPVQVLDHFLELAEEDADRAYGNFLFAQALTRQATDTRQRLRVSQAYKNAHRWASEADSPWLDDILYFYGSWSEREGRLFFDDSGNLLAEPNYELAVELYEELVQRFNRRNSQYVDNARQALERIREEELAVFVSHTYLPESEVSFRVRTRNLEEVKVAIYPVDLNRNLSEGALNREKTNWVEAIESRNLLPWKTYELEAKPEQSHGPWDHEVRIDLIPEPGAYLVEASAGRERARELLLVTGKALVLKSTDRSALVFFADALTGEPVREAEVVFREAIWEGTSKGPRWELQSGVTDTNGLIQFETRGEGRRHLLLVTASRAGEPALVLASGYHRQTEGNRPLAYAYADRSLYRPGDTVHWRVFIRNRENGSYSLPEAEAIEYSVSDPRGNVMDAGKAELDSLGTAGGDLVLPLGEDAVLGTYSIAFKMDGELLEPGSTALFRVEEIELPSFSVGIDVTGNDGRAQDLFQLGDPVHVAVQANYLSGGALVGAEVEVLVYESPHRRIRPMRRETAGVVRPPRPGRSSARIISRKSYTTDGEGKVRFSLPEPTLANQDLEYRVEARVRDGTGSEVVSTRTLLMTRQPYYVDLRPGYQLYRPGDTAEIAVSADDANGNPVEVTGRLKVERLVWEEIWIDPRGRRISGAEYSALRNKRGFFNFGSGGRNYRLLRRGYQVETIDEVELQTDSKGKALFARIIREEGYYRVRWVSQDRTEVPIQSETHFFAADSASNDIGYHHGGLSIIADPGRFVPGVRGPVMITSPVTERWVLLTIGDSELESARVIRMDGTVKLLNLTFNAEHIPATTLEATMLAQLELYQVRQEIDVPAREQELELTLKPGSGAYLPGETAEWVVTIRDHEGLPVEGQFSLAIVDEAGFLIQEDYAGDPATFFYGRRRGYSIRTNSSFSWKRYLDNQPVESDSGVPGPEFETGSGGAELDALQSERLEVSGLGGNALMRSQAVPSPAPMMAADGQMETAAPSGAGTGESPRLRTDFNPAVYWNPSLRTGPEGTARITMRFSDSLTTWRAAARGLAEGHRFGEGKAMVQTRLPLIARLPLPDFLIRGDTWKIPALVQNNESEDALVEVRLGATGVEFLEGEPGARREATIGGSSQGVFNWRIRADTAGEATFVLTATTGAFGDRIEKRVVVKEHGMPQRFTVSGPVTHGLMEAGLEVPAERDIGSTEGEIVFYPNLVGLIAEGFRSLAEGNIPTSEYHASLILSGLELGEALETSGWGSDVPREYFPRGESAGAGGTPETWREWLSHRGEDLAALQNADGGWPWRPGGATDRYMSAYAYWALARLESSGWEADGADLARARDYLLDSLVETEFSIHEQVWILHALAQRFAGEQRARPTREETVAFSKLWKNRERLDSFGLALLLLTADAYRLKEELEILGRNLANGMEEHTSGDGRELIFWSAGGRGLQFAQSEVETTALVIRALSRINPASISLEGAHLWLLRSQRAAGWSNSRESSFAVLGLAAYLKGKNSGEADIPAELKWNGKAVSFERRGSPEEKLAPYRIRLSPAQIESGTNTLGIESEPGAAHGYYRVSISTFTTEEPIPAAGDRLRVWRSYDHLKPQPTLLKGVVEKRVPIPGESYAIGVGERIESVVHLEADQEYPYVVVEDFLPAGFESARLISGGGLYAERVEFLADEEGTDRWEPTEDRLPVYLQIREGKAVFLLDSLPSGRWEIRYTLRAEMAGRYHVLPAVIRPHYLPEVRGNSEELLLRSR